MKSAARPGMPELGARRFRWSCRSTSPSPRSPSTASGLLAIGTMVGLLSGMFGVGGGFILTPLLFFIGIPPAVAVASAANQIAGSSVLGASSRHLPAQDRRLQDGAGAARRRRARLDARRADLHRAARSWASSSSSSACSTSCCSAPSAALMLIESVAGAPPAQRPERGPGAAPAAHLGARAAAEDALPHLEALRQRHPAVRDRRASSASSPRSWGSAAASSWCRR